MMQRFINTVSMPVDAYMHYQNGSSLVQRFPVKQRLSITWTNDDLLSNLGTVPSATTIPIRLYFHHPYHVALIGTTTLPGSMINSMTRALQWRHNGCDGASSHQPHDCLLNRLFKAQIKENTKAPRHWPLCGEFTGDRWMYPFDDVIMEWWGCNIQIISKIVTFPVKLPSSESRKIYWL